MVSISTWKKLQAASGLAFGLYLVQHFLSHYSLIIGWETGNATLKKFRAIYQHPVFECALVASLIVHMVSNTMVYLKRRKIEGAKKKEGGPKPAGTLELKAHRYAGYLLSFLIFGHTFATRIVPLLHLEDPSEYDYTIVKMTNDSLPFNVLAIYLVIFAAAANWHFIYGTRSALATLSDSSVVGKPFPLLLKAFVMILHVLVILSVLSVTGYFYVIDTEPKAEIFAIVDKAIMGESAVPASNEK